MSDKKIKGSNWGESETEMFIRLLIEKQILKLMDGKKYRHIDIYKKLEEDMKEKGFIKNAVQMKTKLKHLKEQYFKCKRNNNTSGASREIFSYYDLMDELLGTRPSALVAEKQHSDRQLGIDTSALANSTPEPEPLAEPPSGLNFEEAEVVEINQSEADKIEPTSLIPVEELFPTESSPTPSTSYANKSKYKKGGRTSYCKSIETLHEVQMKNFTELIEKQHQLQIESMSTQLEAQRKWERESMEIEHQHQTQQMSLVMNTFLKGLKELSKKKGKKRRGSSESSSD